MQNGQKVSYSIFPIIGHSHFTYTDIIDPSTMSIGHFSPLRMGSSQRNSNVIIGSQTSEGEDKQFESDIASIKDKFEDVQSEMRAMGEEQNHGISAISNDLRARKLPCN